MARILAIAASLMVAVSACQGAVVLTTTQGEEADLAVLYSTSDLIQGMIATELPGDTGWHNVNTNPLDRLPAFTDGIGVRATGLTGLLNDFPGEGTPAKLIEYELSEPFDISEIRVFSGNNGIDGRVFHTYTAEFSGDGVNYTTPIYVQSHPSGTLNNGAQPDPPYAHWRVALTQLTDSEGALATGVTRVRLKFYSVDNTGGQMRDPYNGVNPFTGVDDGLSVAFVSPLIWEIDVLGSPSVPIDVTSVGQAKQLGNGTVVNFTAAQVVNLVPMSETGFFYMESADRSAGIRVETAGSLPLPGDTVLVSGRLGTSTDGERVIANATVSVTGNSPVAPMKLTNAAIGGAGFAGDTGAPAAFGLDNTGVLMKTVGKITRIDFAEDYFLIDDGSSVNAANTAPGIKVIKTGLLPSMEGAWAVVTGVVTPQVVDGKKIRVLRGRENPAELEVFTP